MESIKEIATDKLKTGDIQTIRDGVDAYMKIRAEGNPQGLWLESTYDSTAFFLGAISDVLDPNYTWELGSVTKVEVGLAEPFKFENEESGEFTTYSFNTSRIDGERGSNRPTFKSHWFTSSAINAMEDAGFLSSQENEPSNMAQPPFNLDQRIELVRILIDYQLGMVDPETQFKHRYVVPESVTKQFDILSKVVEIAEKIDLKQESEQLKSFFKERIKALRGWHQRLKKGSDYSSYQNPLFYDGDEDQEFLRDSFNHINSLFLKQLSGIQGVEVLDVEELTEKEVKTIVKTYDYAQKVLQESEIRDEHKFDDPPLKIGKREIASFSMDGTTLVMSIEGVLVDHYQIEKKQGEFASHKKLLGKERKTYTQRTTRDELSGYRSPLEIPEGVDMAPGGEYAVEMINAKSKGHDYWKFKILTPEFLAKEKEQVLTEVKENLHLRKMARQMQGVGRDDLYGMPVDEEGNPTSESEADHWVMYMKYNKWINAYPEAYVLVPFSGVRSKSRGATFEALMKDYNR